MDTLPNARSRLLPSPDVEQQTSNQELLDDEPNQDDNDDAPEESHSLPKLQFAMVLLMKLAEPITASVILPFINQVGDVFRAC